MTAPNALTALAEACERAADNSRTCEPICDDERCGSCRFARIILAHARALREGRVTVNEETR